MSPIIYHFSLTTGQAHHVSLALLQSFGVPVSTADYAVVGHVVQCGEVVPISAVCSAPGNVLLTIPPLMPGEFVYELHVQCCATGVDFLVLQGFCKVSELIDGESPGGCVRESITATLNADCSDMSVSVRLDAPQSDRPAQDAAAMLADPEFVRKLKEVCGVFALEEELARKAEQSALEAGLSSKVGTVAFEAGLARKADAAALDAYVPYAKLGRALSQSADGTVLVDLSSYHGNVSMTGESVSLTGTVSASIGQDAVNRVSITSGSAQMKHSVQSEVVCDTALMKVQRGAFTLQNGDADDACRIHSTGEYLKLQARSEIGLRALSGCIPGLFVSGPANGIKFVYNATSSYDYAMWAGNTGVFVHHDSVFASSSTFHKYVNFKDGHN